MRSPWLDIPLADYEGHMSLPSIGQSAMLAAQFSDLLQEFAPESVAVVGCAGGNGFDRIDIGVTKRVVGIDINPHYVHELADRHRNRIPGLEIHVHDIQQPLERVAPVDLVYAALVFEYVLPGRVLSNLRTICRPGGILATILQLPAEHAAVISESPFISLKGLASGMRLVPPASLTAEATGLGFSLRSSRQIRLSSGKEFALQVYST